MNDSAGECTNVMSDNVCCNFVEVGVVNETLSNPVIPVEWKLD
jgi:hypothetical protein